MNSPDIGNILIVIYGHPENYPPTLNAIAELAQISKNIKVLHRPHTKTRWPYPPNVVLVPSGRLMSPRTQEQSSLPIKILIFTNFVRHLLGMLRKEGPDHILVYDGLALLALQLIARAIPSNVTLWYHNHDVMMLSDVRKYSLSWWASKLQVKIFPKLHLFSLPSRERLSFFPMEAFRGSFFYVPNLPSVAFYQQFYQKKDLQAVPRIRLVYQGAVSSDHGFEEIIPLLKERINGKPLELTLLGVIRDDYLSHLQKLANSHQVQDQLAYKGNFSYFDLPEESSRHHIGIAINKPRKVIYKTGGTASNKIYEYAALGLPILYLDHPSYTQHLEQYPWALETDLRPGDLMEKLTYIVQNYPRLSEKANQDFRNRLNFSVRFKKVRDYLVNS